MQQMYKRREAIKIGLGSLAGLSTLGLVSCSSTDASPSPDQENVAMNLLFWGTATRNTATKKAISVFQQRYPNVSIASAYSAFNNYWPMLDKLIATGRTPELLQMDMRYVAKYARSGLMLDLTQLIYEQTIALSDFDPLMLDGSKANNAIYGIPMGGNYQCLIYDTVLFAKSGVGLLPATMTWDTFAEYMIAVAHGLGNVYGTGDSSGDLSVYEIWIRQRGKELYTADGKLAFTVQDVADWFDYWSRMRSSRGCIPADAQAALTTAGGATNSALAKGKSVFVMPHTNEFESYQAAVKNTVDLAFLPLGSEPGLYYKPSQLISISAQTPHVNEAAAFINFIMNDPAGIKAIGVERGIPGSRKAQALLIPAFTPTQLRELNFTNVVSASSYTRLKEILDPPAASQVATLFTKAATDVGLKHTSVSNGAKSFYDAAQKALS